MWLLRLCTFPLLLAGVSVSTNAWAAPEYLLDQRIGWAVSYLSDAVTPSGRFVYRRDLSGKTSDFERYNLLRHAGAVYALAEYHAVRAPDKKSAEAMIRAAKFLIGCCAGPVNTRAGMLAIWSPLGPTGSSHSRPEAKLGGAGLALAALAQLESVLPGTTEPTVLQQIAEFILFMQKPDGSFYSKYIPAKEGRNDDWISLYYPGEAALGLIILYEFDGDLRWLEAAIDALRFLSRIREGRTELPADHWALIATARLFAQDHKALQKASPASIPWSVPQERVSIKGALTNHAEALVANILDEQTRTNGKGGLEGGFTPDGRVSPTATRLEGLLAALSFLPEGELRNRTRQAVGLGIRFLIEAQIVDGPTRGGFTRCSHMCSPLKPRAKEIRIDYVQHALSAMLAFYLLNDSELFVR